MTEEKIFNDKGEITEEELIYIRVYLKQCSLDKSILISLHCGYVLISSVLTEKILRYIRCKLRTSKIDFKDIEFYFIFKMPHRHDSLLI